MSLVFYVFIHYPDGGPEGHTDTRSLLIVHKHIQCTPDYPFSDYPICGLSVHDLSCECLMTKVGNNVIWCRALEQDPQYKQQLHPTYVNNRRTLCTYYVLCTTQI